MSTDATSQGGRPGPLGRFMLAVYIPAVALLAAVALVCKIKGIDDAILMRDPVQTVHAPWYLGLVSNAGILVWCAAVAIAVFTAAVLPRRPEFRDRRLFLLISGLITFYIMLDDLLILHDKIYPDLFHMPEQVVYFVYLPVAIAWIYRFRKQMLAADVPLLVLGAVFMCVSLTMDQWHMLYRIFGRMILPENYLIEDGAKFLSIVTWMGYIARRASDAVRSGYGAAAEE